MPAFNFHKQFAPAVEAGDKTQTIRAKRKDGRRPEPGQTAYLYTGMRTTACLKLGEAEIKEVCTVVIQSRCVSIKAPDGSTEFAFLFQHELDDFAASDGFESWETMLDWFDKTHGLPFEGDLIKW